MQWNEKNMDNNAEKKHNATFISIISSILRKHKKDGTKQQKIRKV